MSEVTIASRDYWFKVVDFLQQSWALVDGDEGGQCNVYFISDASGVFDRIGFPSETVATAALQRNGFQRLADSPEAEAMLAAPEAPFHEKDHPNGRIYSSGLFWR